MQIALFDLTPILWGISALIALLLLLLGEWGTPARMLPAVCVAFLLYGFGYPPRIQVIGFVGMYVLCTISHFCLTRMQRLMRKIRKKAPPAGSNR